MGRVRIVQAGNEGSGWDDCWLNNDNPAASDSEDQVGISWLQGKNSEHFQDYSKSLEKELVFVAQLAKGFPITRNLGLYIHFFFG